MKSLLYALTFVALVTTAVGNGSATWEVWRDADLFKLSSHSTDSVTFTLSGSVLTITCELREAFKTRPTRRLQITIPNFTGIGQYDPTTGTTTYWENFSSTEKCACFNHVINDVNVTKYDSAKKEVGGTFNWKCSSITGGEEINYRIRNGTFDIGASKIALELDPRDTLRIGELQNDTIITVTVTAKNGSEVLEGVKIMVKDSLVSPAPFFQDKGLTNATGRRAYTIDLKKNTPPGIYNIRMYGEKDNFRQSDTSKIVLIYGKRYYYYKCAGLDILEFDAGEGKEWNPVSVGSPIIKTSGGTVTVGGVIKIDGDVRINTTAGANKVFVDGGRVYIPNVKWAENDVSDVELANILTGSDFPLPDCDGLIKLAVNSSDDLKKFGKKLPGGVAIELENFAFINRPDAKGLTMKGKIKIGNARMGCDNVLDTTGGFSVTTDPQQSLSIGIAFTLEKGWENFTFDASNISITNAFCLNQFAVNADFVNQIYGAAGKITFPLKGSNITLGGGGVFKNNAANPENKLNLDSVQVSLTLGDCIQVGSTPFCFKTLNLSASGLSAPTANGNTYRAAAIFNTIEQVILDKAPWVKNMFGSPALAEIELMGQYRHPAVFTGSATTRVIKISKISNARPWQMEGSYIGTVDFNNSISLSGPHKIGHLGLDDYFLTANGTIRLFWNPDIGASSTVTGTVRIPAPGPEILTIPFVGTALRFMQLSGFIPQTLGSATSSMVFTEGTGFSIAASVDVSQNPIDYIRSFGRMSVEFKAKDDITVVTRADTFSTWVQPTPDVKQGEQAQDAAQPTHTIAVDANIDRMFIMVIGAGVTAAPSSTLKAPDGTVYSATSSDSSVRRFATPNGEMVQWTLVNPAVGNWTLTLASPKPGDEVEITVNRKEIPFSVAVASSARTATVTWASAGMQEGDAVRLFLDTDNKDFDGMFIASAPALNGTFTYNVPDALTACSYNIHATRIASGQPMVSVYAPESIHLAGTSGVPAPVEVTALSNQFGRTSVQWRMPLGSSVSGFQVIVTDENGVDSLYKTAFGGERFAILDIADHVAKKIVIVAFDAQGTTSCRTEAISITTGVEDNPFVTAGTQPAIDISIVPNPTSGRTVIRFNTGSDVRANATLDVLNLLGERVATLNISDPAIGWNQAEWDAQGAPSGTYYVRISTPTGYAVAPIAVVR